MTDQPPAAAGESRIAIPARIVESGVVAIGRRLDQRSVIRIGEGLATAGIGAFEITVATPGAFDAIRALAARFGGGELVVGAGTVLTIDDAGAALAAGATFLVMPVTDPTLVAWAAARGIPAFPGAMTPSEALAGWRAGAAGIKLFPASVTGPEFIREFHGPFPDIPVVPTGGVTVDTVASLITAGAVAVGIGSWLIGDHDPAGIAQRGRRVVAVIRAARESGRVA
jgi:2-dehydro-3-deoxyphosphogluconate aldolase / (4S)-4-hydroxy-2-oxoglutarate aldolase